MFFTFLNKDQAHYPDLSLLLQYTPEEVLFYYYNSHLSISLQTYQQLKAEVQSEEDALAPSCQWVDMGQVNKRMLENLILAGCFDSIGISRKEALSIMEECVELSAQIKQCQSSSQLSLFGEVMDMVEEPRLSFKGEFPLSEKLKREKEVLGFFVSANPMEEYQEILPLLSGQRISDLDRADDETYVRLSGMVVDYQRRVSRRGDAYARFYLDDGSGRIEVIVFPRAFKRNLQYLQDNEAVLIEGFYDMRDEQPKISLQQARPIPEVIKELHIRIPEQVQNEFRPQLLQLLQQYPGSVEVFLHLPDRRMVLLQEKYYVKAHLQLKSRITELCGAKNVWFT
jgi:DNA polymerase-3 subunit alpha